MSQFTKTPPTEPGWYWISFYGDPGVFEVMADKDVLFIRYPEVSGPDMDYINVPEIDEYRGGKANILFGPRVLLPPELTGIEAELSDAGPLDVPEILTAAWILRLANEFDVTASDDMPDGERKFHTKFNVHLLGHIWDDMATLWATEGGPPVPPVPEIQPDTATPEADFAAALLAVRTWCDTRAPIAPRQ